MIFTVYILVFHHAYKTDQPAKNEQAEVLLRTCFLKFLKTARKLEIIVLI